MRYLLIFLLALGAVLQSCSVTKKSKYSEKTTVDSTGTTRLDSSNTKTLDTTSVKKDNTVTTIETEGDYTKKTTIEFDTAEPTKPYVKDPPPLDTGYIKVWPTDAADYFAKKQRVKKITIEERGQVKTKEVKQAATYDSTSKHTSDDTQLNKEQNTAVKKTTSVTIKDKKTTSYWAWLWLLLLIPAYLVYRNWPKIKIFLKLV